MKQYTSRKEREHIEKQFDAFMHETIKKCIRNAIKKVSRAEKKHCDISLETLGQDLLGKLAEDDAFLEDDSDEGFEIEADLKIRITISEIRKAYIRFIRKLCCSEKLMQFYAKNQ